MGKTKKHIRLIHSLQKDFESRVRLGIMSVLLVNDWVNFLDMKEWLDVTDGNLASHIQALEKKEFIEVRKQFSGKKPSTSYRITAQGRLRFEEHLQALEGLLRR